VKCCGSELFIIIIMNTSALYLFCVSFTFAVPHVSHQGTVL